MGYGPVPANEKLLKRHNLTWDDIELVELNEALAAQALGCMRRLGLSHDRTNVNGGAIALGHPLGASGARLMTTLVHEMARTGTKYGLQTMCEGGGLSNATILELV